MRISLEVALANGEREAAAARAFHELPAWRRALRRIVPALLLTLIIELFVAFIVSEYTDCNFKLLRVTSVFSPGDTKMRKTQIGQFDIV